MKPLQLIAACALCLLSGSVGASAQDVDVNRVDVRATRGAYRPGQVIVKFKSSSAVTMKAPSATRFSSSQVSEVDRVFREIGVESVSELMPLTGAETHRKAARSFTGKTVEARPMDRAYLLTLSDEAVNVHEVVDRLGAVADVEYAEPNYLVYSLALEDGDVPTDPYYSLQYGIEAINLPSLWKQPVINKTGALIAILDTGVDITHPDLVDNIWTNESEMGGATGYDDDRNGYADDIHGWDFVNQTGEILDYNGHGTHCAGIAAARGFNGLGIVGANPDAQIMPLTVLQSNGTGDIATIIKAVDYAAANGASIISMSLGTYSSSIALEEALGRAYQKAYIVAAAGNDGLCLNHAHPDKGQTAPAPMFPGAYTFVLGVQASAQGGGLASFSNYDDNGSTFSAYGEEKLYNYELTAPGVSIMSTYPGGGYKQLNGTSMATPLMAGALSRLLQAKTYDNKELLFGDLIHSTTSVGDVDFYRAFSITDADRRPEIQFVTIDMVDADGDGRADAGEEVAFYPVIRNSWGNAKNIKFKIEDTNTFDIIEGTAEFGVNLSSYGKARALNPVRIKFHDDVADGRIVRLKFTAEGDNLAPVEQELEVTVENAIDLTGLLSKDMTLTPGQHYVVSGTFGVPEGRTLTIEPGTTIKFRDGSSFKADGTVIADGKPGEMITFTKADLESGRIKSLDFGRNSISYCIFDGFIFDVVNNVIKVSGNNCIYRNSRAQYPLGSGASWKYSNFENLVGTMSVLTQTSTSHINCNLTNCITTNHIGQMYGIVLTKSGPSSSNVFNNTYTYSKGTNNNYSFHVYCGLQSYMPSMPNYVGTSDIEIARSRVLDINHPANVELGLSLETQYDFSNTPTKPYAEAHGIVWKVVVNGYDAQDEFDMLPALGVGKHEFKVYFNRKMNREVAPMIAMGVRPPYTQTAIGENGSWSEEDGVDVYTAYLTISGKNDIDGLNRIYVTGAEDDEFFPIPTEDFRFNVLVQAAGSLSSGFMAEAGLGRVNLTWDNEEEENIDDILGFNMYRYEIDENGAASDTICITRRLLEPQPEMELTDYDVVPRHTYAYYYRTMRTDMSETSPSKTVSVTPKTATRGDANGSGDVDVADVITTVNYASGLEPKPFIFEAADMNVDQTIDILDVVGIIRSILYPNEALNSLAVNQEEAIAYLNNDGILYIETPVALAGVQLNLTMERDGSVSGCETLNGFEQTGAWLSDNDYIFMAYNLGGRTIAPGVHPIARVSKGEVVDIRLSDAMGGNVAVVIDNGMSGLENVSVDGANGFAAGIYTVTCVKVGDNAEQLNRLPAGVYIVNGQKIVK